MGINFLQPKFIIPLLVLPFLALINYVVLDFSAEEKAETVLEEKDEMNTALPEPNLDEIGIDGKLENLQDTFKKSSEFSAISDEIKEGEINDNIEESLYTKEESEEIIRLKDSINLLKLRGSYEKSKNDSPNSYNNGNRGGYASNNRGFDNGYQRDQGPSEEELFLKELRMIDSVINPEKFQKIPEKSDIVPETIIESEKEVKEVVNVASLRSQYFNTIKTEEKTNHIEALIDEKIKVRQGSRVRIKLASDIVIDSIYVPKNSYLYGVVDNFKAQRIEIAITNIFINDKIYDVELDVYDLDGMKGLYVPSSQFREFTKTLGSQSAQNSQNTISIDDNDNQNIVNDLLGQLVRTSTQSASKEIKKNKATLKYNTKVYLLNRKKK